MYSHVLHNLHSFTPLAFPTLFLVLLLHFHLFILFILIHFSLLFLFFFSFAAPILPLNSFFLFFFSVSCFFLCYHTSHSTRILLDPHFHCERFPICMYYLLPILLFCFDSVRGLLNRLRYFANTKSV